MELKTTHYHRLILILGLATSISPLFAAMDDLTEIACEQVHSESPSLNDVLVNELTLTGPQEVRTDVVVNLWKGPLWSLSQYHDEYRLVKATSESSTEDVDLKIKISEAQAKELIVRLGLTQLHSPIFTNGSTWLTLLKEYRLTGPLEVNVDVLASRWHKPWFIAQLKSEYRLILPVREDSEDVDVKVTISETQAKEIIQRLGLTRKQNPVFRNYGRWD